MTSPVSMTRAVPGGRGGAPAAAIGERGRARGAEWEGPAAGAGGEGERVAGAPDARESANAPTSVASTARFETSVVGPFIMPA